MTMLGQSTLAGLRILVVEDVLFVAMEVEDFLRRQGASHVEIASTLERAQAQIRRGGWDAAVVDLNLHGELSIPAIEALRRLGVPLVITTGYTEGIPGLEESLPRLEKPYQLEQLERLLEREVARAAHPLG